MITWKQEIVSMDNRIQGSLDKWLCSKGNPDDPSPWTKKLWLPELLAKLMVWSHFSGRARAAERRLALTNTESRGKHQPTSPVLEPWGNPGLNQALESAKFKCRIQNICQCTTSLLPSLGDSWGQLREVWSLRFLVLFFCFLKWG